MLQPQIFEGIKVVEFAAFAAGPVIGKHLAEHGATSIHVESASRPDGFRSHYPPYLDNKPGLNRSGCFALCNNSKLSVTMNLKAPGGIELAKRLVAWSDVVIENFTPGTMKRLGLGYEELREVRPDLIMLSTCNQGQTGPHAQQPGFGSQLNSLSGFTALAGYPDDTPCMLFGPYIDFIGVGYGVIAVAAALAYRHRTGKGQYLDLSQYEGGVQFIAPALLDYEANGRTLERMGNRHPTASPHGVYPVAGVDRWCALSVHGELEWEAFRTLLGDQPWVSDPRFATAPARKAHEDELDGYVAGWTADRDGRELVELLQGAGICSALVNHMSDLFDDSQLAARGHWIPLEHPELGVRHCGAPPALFSETPARLERAAPCLGEHNPLVFRELLGVTSDEYARLQADGVIETP